MPLKWPESEQPGECAAEMGAEMENGNPSPQTLAASALAEPERQLMLGLAREALASSFDKTVPRPPDPVPPGLTETRACFVTLTKHGALRGCVGSLAPHAPLYETIVEIARKAAFRDPRFPPVDSREVADLKIEISVLNEAQPLQFQSPEELLNLLRPNEDGVLLEIDGRVAMFLPQVWKQIPDKVQFLDRLAEKAGYPPAAWRGKHTHVSVYSVESFGEN
jgi:AmmeMemoRadiSam system protein A